MEKSRILCIKQYLETQTDEEHPATMADILAYLEREGIPANRKNVTMEIGQLAEAGLDVVCNKGRQNQYFIGERHFELPELKLLVDAVQSAAFISPRKTKALTGKLTALVSCHQAGKLNRGLYAVKTDNEKVYLTVDLLHTAIHTEKQVTFKYYEYTPDGKKEYKHGGRVYAFSPYGLVWNSDRYYAVGFSQSHGKVISFRADRIAVPELTDIPALPRPEGFDMAVYANRVFQMYDGPVLEVTLLCENSLMKTIVDRFGGGVQTQAADDNHFTSTVAVAASPTFYGWVFSFAGRIKMTAPENVVNEYKRLLELGR